MALETLAMAAVSSPDSWTLGAGASKVVAVATNDGDTSFINSGTTNGTQEQFSTNDPATIGAGDAIASVAIRATCKRGGSQNANYVVTAVVGANTSAGATQTSTSVYAETTDTFATKPGGGAWTLADVQALEVRIQNAQGRDVRCTLLVVDVTYTPAPVGGPTLPPSGVSLRGVGR